MTKDQCLYEAISITKAWCEGGASGAPVDVLESAFDALVALSEKVDQNN